MTGKRLRQRASQAASATGLTAAIGLITTACVYAGVFLTHLIGDGWTAAIIAFLAGCAVIFVALALMAPDESEVFGGKDGSQ